MENLKKSLDLWKKHGEFVLMATAYRDNVLAEARGCIITDVDGNSFMDLESGQICSILGHNHPKLMRKISEQIDRLLHHGTGFLSEPIFNAARQMAQVTPGGLKKSIFLSTGAEANECALRIAKAYTGKRGIVGFDKGYAGLTLATLNTGASSQDTSLCVPGTLKIITPDCSQCRVASTFPQCDYLCLRVSEDFLKSHCREEIAAFIFEPVLSAGGMIFPPPGYFVKLQDCARRFGALLISDEAQTGMGRTGRWFGVEHDGIVPDILVFSKGAGGGFPSSGVIVTDTIADGILGNFGNFSSHQSDPVAAAAISAVIEVIEEENLLANAEEVGGYFVSRLNELADKYLIVRSVRGRGLMIGADACALPEQKLSENEVGSAFEYCCRQEGLQLKAIHGGRIFRILPPLTIGRDDVDVVMARFEKAMRRVADGDADPNDISSKNPYSKRLEQARDSRLTLSKVVKKGWETSPAAWSRKIKQFLQHRV
jgi:2,2-dialkylglycine decarboxylase (pyruvate)